MGTKPLPTPDTSKSAASTPSATAAGAASKLIAAQNAARKEYEPNPKKNQTYCNDATYCIVHTIGGPLRPLGNAEGNPYSADRIAHNLATSTEYRDVTPEEVQQLANGGNLVIGAWFNPHGHGHIVTVRPEDVPGDEPFGNTGPLLNDIGESDRVARQSGAFKPADKVFYYTPDKRGRQ